MSSRLIVVNVDAVQEEVISLLKALQEKPGIYISLNKPQRILEPIFERNGISLDKLFFIDCVTQTQTNPEVLHILPNKLETIKYALETFMQEIKGKKYLLFDALSTFLIYNDEKKVAQFIKDLTLLANQTDVDVIAVTPETKGEELLEKIYNFFDKVEKK
jgi:hypothetical protein